MTATPNVPDGLSSADLQSLMEAAQAEPEVATDPDAQSEERIIDIAQEAIDYAAERSHGPVVHKAMLHMIVHRMFEWHTAICKEMIEDGQTPSGIGWARDAGKFQAIMNILDTISVDPNDFTFVNTEE